jgi:hypothetical protein
MTEVVHRAAADPAGLRPGLSHARGGLMERGARAVAIGTARNARASSARLEMTTRMPPLAAGYRRCGSRVPVGPVPCLYELIPGLLEFFGLPDGHARHVRRWRART